MRALKRARRAAVLLAVWVSGLALTAAPAHAGPAAADPLVRTDSGWVKGTADAQGRQFLGIPYAAPPVGELRWRAPRPAPAWQGVRDATRFGGRCVQGVSWDPGYEQPTYTEDCLGLNVYAPTGARPGRAPVMVWFHGGGLTAGAGSDVVPDTFSAEGGIVSVTVNYRVGAMGFLSVPALDGEAADGTSGNFGMLDQQAALRWVRRNIARFGGDPARVTIAGESAGGRSVCTQLASPPARGLFRAAIIQSGAYGDCAASTRREAADSGTAFAASLGCDDPATAATCLRAKSPRQILEAQGRYPWAPVAGGDFLPVQPSEAFATGRSARVPVLNGANRDEGRMFIFSAFDYQGRPLTAEQYPQVITGVFGPEQGARVLGRYPVGDFPSPTIAYGTVHGDATFACTALRLDRALAGRAPVYAYEFADRTSPPFESLRNLGTDFDFGATHVNELQYLFHHFGHEAPFNAEQRALARQMRAYWTSFVRTGVPRAPDGPAMPEQHTAPGTVLALRTVSQGGSAVTGAAPRDHQCGMWDVATAR
ncbi:carboxylesterase/lipase family protein [Streptomyces sp. LZ34]